VLERQNKELTAALLRTAIPETETRMLREALVEAWRQAWRRWFRLAWWLDVPLPIVLA